MSASTPGLSRPDSRPGDPAGARIIGVCDAYVRMTTEQPYQRAFSTAEAVDELRRCAGTQFDPAVVDVVCDLIGRPGRRSAAAA
jgi:HD-GYP domain-containing protein (c-di-GMP phosphodiesterase class II)